MLAPSSSIAGKSASIYDQIGGAAAVEAAVQAFYERVLADPLLEPFFEGTNLNWLKKSQVRFFTTALGGPAIYKGRDMRTAHADLPIEEKHFGQVALHLSETLKALKVPAHLIAKIMETAGSLAPEIIKTTTVLQPNRNQIKSMKLATPNAPRLKKGRGISTGAQPLPAGIETHHEDLSDLRGKIAALDRSQAVIEFELDGVIVTANENFLKTLGYRLDEIQGQHHSLFVEPAYRESAAYKQFWRDLSDGKFQSAEYKRVGKGGKEIWIQASYNPIFDLNGRPTKVVKFATDVTQAVQQRLVNTRYASMADNSPINIMFADTELRIQYLNQASKKPSRHLKNSCRCRWKRSLGKVWTSSTKIQRINGASFRIRRIFLARRIFSWVVTLSICSSARFTTTSKATLERWSLGKSSPKNSRRKSVRKN